MIFLYGKLDVGAGLIFEPHHCALHDEKDGLAGYLFRDGDRWKACTHTRAGFDAEECATIAACLRSMPPPGEYKRRFEQLAQASDDRRAPALAGLLNYVL